MKTNQRKSPEPEDSEIMMVEKIKKVIARGNHAEVTRPADGSFRVYEVKKSVQ